MNGKYKYEMVSKRPARKIVGGGIAGAVTALILWLLSEFGISVDADVASAITVIVTFIAGYLVRPDGGDFITPGHNGADKKP